MELLEMLESYGPSQFRAWLQSKFEILHTACNGAVAHAFDFREAGISLGIVTPQENLLKLFHKLSGSARQNFRHGVCELISNATLGCMALPAMEDLMFLALQVNATDALDALIPKIVNGEWGKKHLELVWDCANIMQSLGKRQEEKKLRHEFHARQRRRAEEAGRQK